MCLGFRSFLCFVVLGLTQPLFCYGQSTCEIIAQRLKSGDLLNIESLLNTTMDCPNLLGQVYLRKGNNQEAENYFNEALSRAKSNKSLRAEALNNLGLVYWNTGNTNKGREFIKEALELRINEFGENHELTAASFNDLGLILSGKNPDLALTHYESALGIYQTIYGNEHEKTIQASINTGVVYRAVEYY